MQRRHSVPPYQAKAFKVKTYLWEHAKQIAATDLSKRDEEPKTKSSILHKLICRSRTSSELDRIKERERKYLDLAKGPLISFQSNTVEYHRKLAVCEESKEDREMVCKTIKYYRQITALQSCELW